MKRLLVAIALMAGCGDGGGSQPAGICTGKMGASAACVSCQTSSCDSQTAACLGAGYKSGSFTGPCADYVACTCKCASTDLTCLQGCQPKYTTACLTCSQTLQDCVQQSCGTVCGTGANPDMAMSGGNGFCAKLAACCPTLPGSQQAGCNSLAGAGNDTNCGMALTGYHAANECM